MLFNSFEFIFLFLPLVCIFFYFLNNSYSNLIIIFLSVISLIFYQDYFRPYIFIILISIIVNYFIYKNLNQYKKKLLLLGILFNLCLLAFFKYQNFVIENLRLIFNDLTFSLFDLKLPLAISFFTFQQIAFLVDTYKKKTNYKFKEYILFVTFFPQLIAGPIVYHNQIIPQFRNVLTKKITKKEIFNNFIIGFNIFVIGLFKKIVIGDTLGITVDFLFVSELSSVNNNFYVAWLSAFLFGAQIYFDFSGYSDMAIGLAKIFGINLPINFNYPYKSFSIIEFWKKWHITLSNFLKKYIYFPLGGNRKGTLLKYFNISIVMLIGGLWHGAAWKFVLWGLIHGLFIIVNHVWATIIKKKFINNLSPLIKFILFILSVNFAWIPFRAKNISETFNIWETMLNPINLFRDFNQLINLKLFSYYIELNSFYVLIVIFLLCIIYFCEKKIFFPKNNTKVNFVRISLLFIISILFIDVGNEFIYFAF